MKKAEERRKEKRVLSTKEAMVAQEAKTIIVAEAAKAAGERRRNETEGGRAGRRSRAKGRRVAQKAPVERHHISVGRGRECFPNSAARYFF